MEKEEDFEPMGSKILVKRFKKQEKTAKGFILPETMQKPACRGVVRAVGPGKMNEAGNRIPQDVKVGDEILFSEYAGQLIETEERTKESDLIILEDENEILAKIKKK